jgi:hypothetical protein
MDERMLKALVAAGAVRNIKIIASGARSGCGASVSAPHRSI